jgi:hypothetical protein
MYHDAGFDFIAITDHWKAYRKKESDPDFDILTIDGIEIDGNDASGHYYHIVALGPVADMTVDPCLERSIEILVAQHAFLILAHPYWSGNREEDIKKFPFHALEIYNHVCSWLNGKGTCAYLWDVALEDGLPLFAIASDDAHLLPAHPGWNGGWIMVQAEELTQTDILTALRKGRFIATTGPHFKSISYDNETIACTTGDIVKARLVGAGYSGDRLWYGGDVFNEFTFDISKNPRLKNSPYLRLEIEDANGKIAWTNQL